MILVTALIGRQYCLIRNCFARISSEKSQLRRILWSKATPLVVCGAISASGIGCRVFRVAQCKTKGKDRVSASHLYRKLLEEQNKSVIVKRPNALWRDIWHLIKPDVLYLIGAIATAILAAVVNVYLPLLLGDVVNFVATLADHPENFEELKPSAVKLALLYCLQGGLTSLYIGLLSIMGERIATRMRTRLFHSLIVQDVAFFDSQRTGELVARLSSDVQEFKSAFKQCISQGLRSITQTAGCVISLYFISPQMTMMTVVVLPCIIVIGTGLGSFLRVLSRQAQAQVAMATSVADEALTNIRTVRAFAMEDAEEMLFNRELEKAQYLNEALGLGIGFFQGVANIALNGIVLGVIYGGSRLICDQELSPGQLTSFLVTAQTIQRSLAQLSLLFGEAVKGLTAGAKVFEYVHMKPTIPIKGGQIIPYHTLIGEVRFEHVNFAYPTRSNHVVLNDFSLRIAPGTTVALCGPSGGGKSTVAALLERFYDVAEGRITIDGVDIRNLDPGWLRGRTIGFISQEPVLFHTTIKENIRYGKPGANDKEIIDAAQLANAHQFIDEFPNGYDTVVGERGVTLSGGQKQRIAIARALLKNPTILILDEATSALDAESERLVQEALDRVGQGRTVLVIAHRLSTVQKADQIAVIANKRVVEIGTHHELLRRQGVYWQLVKYQQEIPEVIKREV